jgi:hypothetical protein
MTFVLLDYKLWGALFAAAFIWGILSSLSIIGIPAALITLPVFQVVIAMFIGTYLAKNVFRLYK